MLAHIVERIRFGMPEVPIIIATSDSQTDDGIAALASELGVACYRGSLANVALRFLEAADANRLDYAVRITGDSLFIDTAIIQSLLRVVEAANYALISNRLHKMFPIGESVEIVHVNSYRKYFKEFSTEDDFEHVTEFFHRNQSRFQDLIYNYPNPDGVFREISLAIDTPQEFERAKAVYAKLKDKVISSSYKEIYELMQQMNKEVNSWSQKR
jgi:spore coat polysaccharide biosynthesis protein SpsF